MSDSESHNEYRGRYTRTTNAQNASNAADPTVSVRAPSVADLRTRFDDGDADVEELPYMRAAAPSASGSALHRFSARAARSPRFLQPYRPRITQSKVRSPSSSSEMSNQSDDSPTDAVTTNGMPRPNFPRSIRSQQPHVQRVHQARSGPSAVSHSSAASHSSFASGVSRGPPSLHPSHQSHPYSTSSGGSSQPKLFMKKEELVDENDDDLEEKNSEFVMRYTPVECDANQFGQNYSLRTIENQRNISIFIVVTMYNEDQDELKRTLKGLMRNIDTFTEHQGAEGWKDICLCIVSDGRHKADKGSLDYLEELGIFDANMMHSALDNSTSIQMHLFESTLFLPSENINNPNQPLQTVFALKERNGGKLDSHHWFFNAFSVQLNPKYCFMFDVGTKPENEAVLRLYAAMERDENIGGCCGEITTRVTATISPWIAAQQFEYKIATILDKAMESVFGFISVLPGAFSAYRFEAISGEPLQQYFKQINTDIIKISPFKGNMYLAEDRILCFEVLAEKNCHWILKYVKGARAATDVPESLTDLIKQRRRWLNGSLFAMIYAIGNFRKFIENSSHTRLRKSFISVQFLFYTINIIMTWFLLANFYLMFEFAGQNHANFKEMQFTIQVFRGLFLILTLIQCVAGLGNRPDELPHVYFLCAIGYGVFFAYTLMLNAELLFSANLEGDTSANQAFIAKASALGGIAVYVLAGLIHGDLFAVMVSIIQYFFMLPTFLIGFPIYSFCNIHDISWGTKGLETSDMAEGATRKQKEMHAQVLAKRKADLEEVDARFRTFRSNLVIGWLASNALFYQAIATTTLQISKYYVIFTFVVFFGLNAFKMVFCLIFMIQEWTRDCCTRKKKRNKAEAINIAVQPTEEIPSPVKIMNRPGSVIKSIRDIESQSDVSAASSPSASLESALESPTSASRRNTADAATPHIDKPVVQ